MRLWRAGLYEIFAAAPKGGQKRILQQPSRSITGAWEVDID